MTPQLLEGKVAIVTGAVGIGAASAHALANEGACVMVADINEDAAKRTAQEIVAGGGRAASVVVDQSDEAQVARAVGAAVREFGGIDILHNNAAATQAAHIARDGFIHELDTEVWDRTLAVNLRGYMLFTKHVVPSMLSRKGGVIINTASGTGVLAEYTRAAYGTSKAAIIGLTRNIATQYGRRGIRCVCIAPGIIQTPAVTANVPPEALAALRRHHLTPRLGVPEDIGHAVVFLASDRAGFITGITIPIDGGFCSHVATYADEVALVEASRPS